MKKDLWPNILKGLAVGASMLIPGVSGGTMAIILGIYDKLIVAISSFFYHKRQSLFVLGSFLLGSLLGIFLFAHPLLYLTENYTMLMMYFFIGAIAGSIPMIYRKARTIGFTPAVILYPLLGAGFVLLFSFLPSNFFTSGTNSALTDYLLLALAGLVAAIALILPGISVSYMLLLLGMYDKTIRALSELYFPFLFPLALGLLLGIFLTTRALEKAMTNYPQATYLIILGFIIGSVASVFPGWPTGPTLIFCPLLFVFGFLLIIKISQTAGA